MNNKMRYAFSVAAISAFFISSLISPIQAQAKDTSCIRNCKYTTTWQSFSEGIHNIMFNRKNESIIITHQNNTYTVHKIIQQKGKLPESTVILTVPKSTKPYYYDGMQATTMHKNTLVTAGFLTSSTNSLQIQTRNTLSGGAGGEFNSQGSHIIPELAGFNIVNRSAIKIDDSGALFILVKNTQNVYKVAKFSNSYLKSANKLELLFVKELSLDSDNAWDINQDGNIYYVNRSGTIKVLLANKNYQTNAELSFTPAINNQFTATQIFATDIVIPSDIFVVYQDNSGAQKLVQVISKSKTVSTIQTEFDTFKISETARAKRLLILASSSTDNLKTMHVLRTSSNHELLRLFIKDGINTLPSLAGRNYSGDIFFGFGNSIAKLDFNFVVSLANAISSLQSVSR